MVGACEDSGVHLHLSDLGFHLPGYQLRGGHYPTFFVSGTRFFLAGLILFAIGQIRTPTQLNWRNRVAAISMGALFFLACHGGLSWAAG